MLDLKMPITAEYLYGSYAYLTTKWKADGVKIAENKAFYITKGEICITVKGVKHIFKKGDMVIIPAGLKHDYQLTELECAEKYWFHFHLTSNGANILDRYDMPFSHNFNDEKIEKLFDETVNASSSAGYPYLQASNILKICSLFLDACAKPFKPTSTTELEEVLFYINENLSSNISLKTLAEIAHLSNTYFIKKFKKILGVSPIKYLSIARLERAKMLLSTSDMRISDIMVLVGITDGAYFSKFIKSATGYSPKTFREISKQRVTFYNK